MKGKITIFLLIALASWIRAYSHPYFVSSTEIHIHPENKSFDVSCSMFTEDLESALKSIYANKADLKQDIGAKELLDMIYQYIQARLEIKVGGEKQTYELVGCENQEESTWCYLEGTLTSDNKSVSIVNSVLFDFLEAQTNMVHVYWGEERQSVKLNNPHKTAEFVF
jgi:hypothetical protein